MTNQYAVTTFYHFADLGTEKARQYATLIEERAKALEVYGLVIIASEGVNATVAALPGALQEFKEFLTSMPEFGAMKFKDSQSEERPFPRFKVKMRDEIVTSGKPEIKPWQVSGTHVTPEEWNRMMREDDVVVLDTRNKYEVEVGKFKGAVDPELEMFSEFGDFAKQWSTPRDKKVLIYCTGGIRCEKAIVEMKRAGYANVYQLDGGILNYLKEFPEGFFEGECFVFDHRVAVDAKLEPSERWHLCPHCGDPGDVALTCERCGEEAHICERCSDLEVRRTCSKDCAHHYGRVLTSRTSAK